MADANAKAASLLQNEQFLQMFQKALGDEKIPDEGDPNRDAFLKKIQDKLHEQQQKEMKEQLEKPVTDAEGQWMWVVPEPGFCVKCSTHSGGKVFINITQHPKIAEPMPLPDEEQDNEHIKFKIPLSCGAAREDVDRSGKACKVYDVIVNPNTIQKCKDENEFRRFVAALCMSWIKQKSEKDLNDEEFKNLNFKCKGKPDMQRIRLAPPGATQKANAMNDEINLPKAAAHGTAPSVVGGSTAKPLVQEVAPKATIEVTKEGSYDWSTHKRAAKNPYIREEVCSFVIITAFLPDTNNIREVDVQISTRTIDLVYVDSEDGKPFLSAPIPFPCDDEPVEAKFLKKKHTLVLKLKVSLPDETLLEELQETRAKEKADAEAAEEKARQEKAEAEMNANREKFERLQKEEQDVMKKRKELVESLQAVTEGAIPPQFREELEKMPPEDLRVLLMRLESRTKKGDSVDTMLEKLPDDVIDSITGEIRKKLGLEPVVKKPSPAEAKKAAAAAKEAADQQKKIEAENASNMMEYNFAKKAEKLFGVEFYNRYLFALDY